MKALKAKKDFLIFSLVTVSFFNSCQSVKPIHNEEHRQQHAKEILSGTYLKSAASRFEKDPLLASYIEDYLKENGRELASREVVKSLIEVSKKNQYDPIFLMAIIKTESQFRPEVVGQAGEIGLMQIKPDTAKWICEKQGLKWKGAKALKDPSYNIQVGALYFKYLRATLKAKASHYVIAYNRGIGSFNRLPSSERETNIYFAKVLRNYLSIYSELEKIKVSRL